VAQIVANCGINPCKSFHINSCGFANTASADLKFPTSYDTVSKRFVLWVKAEEPEPVVPVTLSV
jgi:hypothetical protein